MHRNELIEKGRKSTEVVSNIPAKAFPGHESFKKRKRAREKGNQPRDGIEDEKYVNNPDRIQISSSKPLC